MTVALMNQTLSLSELKAWLRFYDEKHKKSEAPQNLDTPDAVAKAFKL